MDIRKELTDLVAAIDFQLEDTNVYTELNSDADYFANKQVRATLMLAKATALGNLGKAM